MQIGLVSAEWHAPGLRWVNADTPVGVSINPARLTGLSPHMQRPQGRGLLPFHPQVP